MRWLLRMVLVRGRRLSVRLVVAIKWSPVETSTLGLPLTAHHHALPILPIDSSSVVISLLAKGSYIIALPTTTAGRRGTVGIEEFRGFGWSPFDIINSVPTTSRNSWSTHHWRRLHCNGTWRYGAQHRWVGWIWTEPLLASYWRLGI